MTMGDVVRNAQSLPPSNGLDIRPPAGEEWVIHNFYYETGGYRLDMQVTDGVTSIVFDSDNSNGARMGMTFHVTNTQWIRLLNSSAGTTMKVAYDGIQTK